jgi:hypothetical protein
MKYFILGFGFGIGMMTLFFFQNIQPEINRQFVEKQLELTADLEGQCQALQGDMSILCEADREMAYQAGIANCK